MSFPLLKLGRSSPVLAVVSAMVGVLVLSGCDSSTEGEPPPKDSSRADDRPATNLDLPPAVDRSRIMSEQEPSPFRFAEVAKEAGIDFVHVSGTTPEKPFPTANGSGVAIFDYDNDGKMDLLFLSNCFRFYQDRPDGQCRLYRNLGDWKFEDVTDTSGLGFHGFVHGAIAADFDNDGDADVFLATYRENTFFLNNGDGTFTNVGKEAGVAPSGFRGRIAGGGTSSGPVVVEAVAGLKWRVDGGEPTDDLTIKVKPGQRIVFTQADPESPRGLELLADPGVYRRLDETEQDKPNAALVEVGPEGATETRFYRGQPPLPDGAEPAVIAELEVARDIDRPIGFECSEHRTAWSSGGAALDYDNDGDLDFYVTNYGFWTVEDHGDKFCGNVEKGVRQYCSPKEVTTVRHILYRNDGVTDGIPRFTDVTEEAGTTRADGHGFGAVAADLDGDNLIDLYVANDQNPAFLYLNNGHGTFRDATDLSGAAYDDRGNTQSGMGVDAADVDGDGKPELFRTNFAQEYNTLYYNLGNGAFFDQTASYGLAADAMAWVGWGCFLGDFDNDGWPDAFVTNGHVDDNYYEMGVTSIPYEEPPLLHRNVPVGAQPNASRRFRLATKGVGPYFESSHVGRGAAFGDLDTDGRLDIVVNHKDGAPGVLRNETPADGNHWIMLRLTGTASNRDAIGAKVQVVLPGRTIARQVKGGCSLESTNDKRLLIGVGPEAKAETVLIRWPSGRESVLKDVAMDQVLDVEEPAE